MDVCGLIRTLLLANMASPSPSDLMWVIGYTPQGRWIAPVVRAAVKAEWRNARFAAKAQLGDGALAHELMESAISETKEYLADLEPVDVQEARKILARFYGNAIKRMRRSNFRLSFRGTGADFEFLSPSTPSTSKSVEAKLDLDTILRDTPAELRHALLMRYGTQSRWEEVAEELTKSKDSIRMSCQRELERIRRKLGIRGRTE
jgi:DNA-directed RNA polymerase specialized sigma24 family protein